jgi:GNAT superfamily N-acetyltransferase
MPQRPVEEREAVTSRGLVVRPAKPEDVPALVSMVNAAYRVSEGDVFPGTTRVQRTDAMRQLDGTLVLLVDGELAGCVRFELEPPVAHFGLLATEVSRQGAGIGSRLIGHVEQLARNAGCTTMRIEVVKEGGRVPFYERRGYTVTSETDGQEWNGGQDWGASGPWHMVEMEKRL